MELPGAGDTGRVVKHKVREAFLAVRDGFSADRVVADPHLNQRFIEQCRLLGLRNPSEQVNQILLNARKGRFLTGCEKSKRTSFKDEQEYRFASEIAIRFLERRERTTIDRIICSPVHAEEFDRLARSIAPGYTALQYRWAALNLRKSRSLPPERMSHVVPSEQVELHLLTQLNLESIPASQGLYVFVDSASHRALYVGESENLLNRIAKHLEHSDNKGLARWLWEQGAGDIWVEYHLLPDSTLTKVRRALENEMIHSRNPIFNVLGR